MTHMTHRPDADASSATLTSVTNNAKRYALTWRNHMTDKTPILPVTFVENATALRSWAATGLEDRRITRRQFSAIELLARPHLPCQVELLQRSAKSVLYLHVDRQLEYRIGQRAQVYGGQARKVHGHDAGGA